MLLACHEKGIDFDHRQLDFAGGEHKSPAFLAKNPKGTLPTLFDGDRLLTDTLAMLQCVQRQPGPTLLGETQEQRAHGMKQLRRACDLKEAGMQLLSAHMKGEATHEPLGLYLKCLEHLCDARSGRGYFAPACEPAQRPGLADLLAYPYLATSEHLALTELGPSLLGKWFEKMRQRASVRATEPA